MIAFLSPTETAVLKLIVERGAMDVSDLATAMTRRYAKDAREILAGLERMESLGLIEKPDAKRPAWVATAAGQQRATEKNPAQRKKPKKQATPMRPPRPLYRPTGPRQ